MARRTEKRLMELNITLPGAVPAVANYAAHIVTGNLVYISGQLPLRDGKLQFLDVLATTFRSRQASWRLTIVASISLRS